MNVKLLPTYQGSVSLPTRFEALNFGSPRLNRSFYRWGLRNVLISSSRKSGQSKKRLAHPLELLIDHQHTGALFVDVNGAPLVAYEFLFVKKAVFRGLGAGIFHTE